MLEFFYALFLLGFTCYSNFHYTSQKRFWKALIGTEMSSSVVKQDCEPYEYVVKDTGEVITLNHKYVYESEVPTTTQQDKEIQRLLAEEHTFSSNGEA